MKNKTGSNGTVTALAGLVLLCAFMLICALMDPQTKADFGLLDCATCHE